MAEAGELEWSWATHLAAHRRVHALLLDRQHARFLVQTEGRRTAVAFPAEEEAGKAAGKCAEIGV